MNRVIFITIFTALTLGLIFIAGCPKPTCKRMPNPKVIGISYPNLPGGKVDTSRKYYPVTVIITERNNVSNVIDTMSKNIPCDTTQYLWLYIRFEKEHSGIWPEHEFLLGESWKPNNIIVIVDSTKYRDTLTNIVFHNNPKSYCLPDDAIGVSFYLNGKYVYIERPSHPYNKLKIK